MQIDLFAGIPVSDYPRAVSWFERLVGRPAGFEPNDVESVWTLTDHGHVWVEHRPERAGRAMVTLYVDDLDGFLEAAAGRGLVPDTEETYDNGVRKTIFVDPDGNEIGVGGGPGESSA